MHCDLAAFEASADGHKYCLVAAVTIEVDHESKLLPFFVPMPKKDAVCATAALKEALTMCDNRNLHQITGSRIVRIQADGGGEFIAERMVGMLKSERCMTWVVTFSERYKSTLCTLSSFFFFFQMSDFDIGILFHAILLLLVNGSGFYFVGAPDKERESRSGPYSARA